MTEEFQLNDDTYTGTKEVSENLKFESKLLQEWIMIMSKTLAI